MSTTYYLKLKSGENQACCTQTIEASGLTERPSVYVTNVARKAAKAWGQGNGSKTVRYAVETYAGDEIGSGSVAVPLAAERQRTIEKLADAVKDEEAFCRLVDKWGISNLEVVAKLAAEEGLIDLEDFNNARFTFDW